MNREDIIRMALEAGFFPDWNWDRTNWHAAGFSDSFERFAALVAAAEREACAKVCEDMRPSKAEYDQRFYTACTLNANAIKARGNK